MKRLAPLCAAFGLLLAAAPAGASTVRVENGQLVYSAAKGERNSTEISSTKDGSQYEVYENAAYPGKHATTFDAGPGCAKDPKDPVVARCSTAGVQAISVTLRDRGDDLILHGDLKAPVTYSGGKGIDGYSGYGAEDVPVSVSADGQADDGPYGRDNVLPDVETLGGGVFADKLTASVHGGRLGGGAGDDTLTGRGGNDRLFAAYVETVGLDSGDFYREGTDTVDCGGGHDLVLADDTDHVDKSCEVVGRNVPNGGGFVFRGSNGRDRIKPPYFWAPATVFGRGGNDVLLTPNDYGDYKLEGGRGNDRLRGGNGVDVLEGGPGNDVLRSFDKNKNIHDKVRCGSGFDTAYVDTRDRVRSDCERVIFGRG